jgi:hypothetical protein
MPEKPSRSGLDEFRAVIADYKSIGPWVMGGTVLVPLVDYVLRLGPPWPEGVVIITSVVELLVLISVFHFWFGSGYKRVSRRMVFSFVLLVVSFGAYLYFNSSYTFTVGTSTDKYVKGFVLRPDVAPLIAPDFTPDDALSSAEYRPEAVWTAGSITAVRLVLLSLWLTSFVLLSTAIASFVIYHRRRPAP